MQALKHSEIFGNWATLLLPIRGDDQIDYILLEQEIDQLISMQVNGIYSNGTAGEFFNQTEAEFDRISELLAHKCNAAGMPFQIGCSHLNPVMTLSRIERTVSLRPGAIQVILPDWVTTSFQETCRYLSKLTEVADSISLVLYNPPHAKNVLRPKDYQLLQEAGLLQKLAGVKVFGGEVSWYQEMNALNANLSIFIPGHFLASGISKGASGAYSNVACLHPAVGQYWYDMTQTDLSAALELEFRIVAWMKENIHPFLHRDGYSNMAADKLLAAIGDWSSVGTRLRWPYQGFSDTELVSLRETAQKALPEFFNPDLRNYRKASNIEHSISNRIP